MGLLDSDTILGSADGPAFVDLAGLGDSRAGDPAWPDSLLPDDPLRRRFYGAILGIDPQPGRRGADDAAAGGLNASPAAPAGAAAWRAATPRPPAAAAPAETMPRGDDDELTAHHGALERAVMDSARQDGHLAADELQKIYGPGATGEFRFASRAPAATSPPPELQPWAQRQPATNEGRGTGPSDSQDLAAQAQPAFTAPTGPVAPDATSADDLAFHQAVLRHALRSVGAPPEYMEPRDITGAARLMAEQGLAPADAFARATVRDALEQSHFAPADIDKIYSPGVAGAIAGNPLQSATANLGGFRPSQDNEPPIAGEKIDSADMQASWPDGGTAASLNLERQQNFARADRPSAPTDISSARRGPQRGGPLLPEPTVFQRQALSNALSRLQRAMQEIRKLHPRWRPQTSSLLAPDSNQGVIDHAQERAREAENHLADLRRRSIGGNYGPPLQAKPRVPAPWSASGWIKAYRAANSRPDLFGHPTRVTDKDTVRLQC